MPKKYSIVPVDPKTGKEIARPKKGRSVFYAVKSPRGTLKKIPQDFPQKFYKTDFQGLNAILNRTGPENLVLYEQKSAEVIPGKYRRKKDSQGRKIPQKKLKLTYRQAGREQRPVVLSVGKRVKKTIQDGALKKLTKRQQVDAKLAKIIKIASKKSDVFSKEIFLKGDTIFETLKNVKPGVSASDLKRSGANTIWVEGVVRIYSPQGALSHAVRFSHTVKQLRNFSQEIAKEIRYKLSDVGYRFTSLADLEEFQDELEERGASADLMHMGFAYKPVTRLIPLRPEAENGERLRRGQSHSVSVSLRITGFRDPTRKKKTQKKKTQKKKTQKKKIQKRRTRK